MISFWFALLPIEAAVPNTDGVHMSPVLLTLRSHLGLYSTVTTLETQHVSTASVLSKSLSSLNQIETFRKGEMVTKDNCSQIRLNFASGVLHWSRPPGLHRSRWLRLEGCELSLAWPNPSCGWYQAPKPAVNESCMAKWPQNIPHGGVGFSSLDSWACYWSSDGAVKNVKALQTCFSGSNSSICEPWLF